jgi:hypothetical protein
MVRKYLDKHAKTLGKEDHCNGQYKTESNLNVYKGRVNTFLYGTFM